MNYLMTPLNEHPDEGFGATANAFLHAAQQLRKARERGPFDMNDCLPINYLFRHAIELYLKSGIIIFHRRLNISFGTQPSNSPPQIMVAGKWKPLFTEHSISNLYGCFQKLVSDNLSFLSTHTKSDWTLPADAEDWVRMIEESDPKSDYLRYPISKKSNKDLAKAAMKRVDPWDIVIGPAPGEKPIRALIVENEHGEVTRAYSYDHDALLDLATSLEKMADLFYGVHAAIRHELCGGW